MSKDYVSRRTTYIYIDDPEEFAQWLREKVAELEEKLRQKRAKADG